MPRLLRRRRGFEQSQDEGLAGVAGELEDLRVEAHELLACLVAEGDVLGREVRRHPRPFPQLDHVGVVAVDPPVGAAVGHLRQLAARIRLVRRQLAECREKLDEIFARLGAEQVQGRKNEPRDVDILLSLPGVGRIVAASLLAEASRPLRDRDYQALRTLSGVAPVTKRSGKGLVVEMRRACNPRLRNALYHAARNAGQSDDAWKSRCAAMRAGGQTHGRACRGLADALLRVAIAMLRTRTLYDPSKIGATRAKAAA